MQKRLLKILIVSHMYELFCNDVAQIMFDESWLNSPPIQSRKIQQYLIENMCTLFIIELLSSIIGLSSQNVLFSNSQTWNNNNNNNNSTRNITHTNLHENMCNNHDLCSKWLINAIF